MRMSCNGCRVLRKGCSDSCSIRPCLQWIKSSESQANATVFLAKFYGRAGLMNLINSGPEHLRSAIYRSLLYEACGRIVNPIYGSVGLLWSGSWPLCQAAVEAVLKGVPIAQIPSEAVAASPAPPPKAYDIPHVLKSAGADAELHKVSKSRSRFKRPGAKLAATLSVPECQHFLEHATRASRAGEAATVADRKDEECTENECTSSADTEQETSHVSQGEPDLAEDEGDEDEVALRLALGFEPVTRSMPPSKPVVQPRFDAGDLGLTL